MNKLDRTQEIRQSIIEQVSAHPADITRVTAEHFGITRQMAARHLRNLVNEGLLEASGRTSARVYQLKVLLDEFFAFDITPEFEEDIFWRNRIAPLLDDAKSNVVGICQHGVTEMLNNVLEHSGSPRAVVHLVRDAANVEIMVQDFGIGIFNKIQQHFGLDHPHDALLELAKGKLSSDEERHSGEGIFFTSRMFDDFFIISGGLFFSHLTTGDDWLIETDNTLLGETGTRVRMTISLSSERTRAEVFNEYRAEHDEYGFSRTHVPIKLARFGEDELISRSQAKRVLSRFERFKEVILDFKDVPSIGQAFADEIFRVYRNSHPETIILPINTSPEVQGMIMHVTMRIFEKRESDTPP